MMVKITSKGTPVLYSLDLSNNKLTHVTGRCKYLKVATSGVSSFLLNVTFKVYFGTYS